MICARYVLKNTKKMIKLEYCPVTMVTILLCMEEGEAKDVANSLLRLYRIVKRGR